MNKKNDLIDLKEIKLSYAANYLFVPCIFKVLQVLLSVAVSPNGKSEEQSSANKKDATNLLL